jgi:hypothetical protein
MADEQSVKHRSFLFFHCDLSLPDCPAVFPNIKDLLLHNPEDLEARLRC